MVDGTGTHTCYIQWVTVPAHTCIEISRDAFSFDLPYCDQKIRVYSSKKKYCYRYSTSTDSRESPLLFSRRNQ